MCAFMNMHMRNVLSTGSLAAALQKGKEQRQERGEAAGDSGSFPPTLTVKVSLKPIMEFTAHHFPVSHTLRDRKYKS